MNILFVCAANMQRSPSFERWFKLNKPEYNVKSTGTYYGYPERLSIELLSWANKVYVMDLSQEMFISRKYPEFLHKCEVIGCSDQYSADSPELKELIYFWVNKVGL